MKERKKGRKEKKSKMKIMVVVLYVSLLPILASSAQFGKCTRMETAAIGLVGLPIECDGDDLFLS
jgi:hypothetical protein